MTSKTVLETERLWDELGFSAKHAPTVRLVVLVLVLMLVSLLGT